MDIKSPIQEQREYPIPKSAKPIKHTFLPIVMTSETARHQLDKMKAHINLIKSINKIT